MQVHFQQRRFFSDEDNNRYSAICSYPDWWSNAVKDFDVLLDTGSTYVIILWEDAIDLGYEPSHARSIHLGTASGLVSAPLIILDYIEMLGFKIEKIDTVVKDLVDTGINSVIGWSLLKYFDSL